MPPLPCAAPKLLLLEVLPVVDHGPLGRLGSLLIKPEASQGLQQNPDA